MTELRRARLLPARLLPARLIPWLFAGLCLGGIAHILSILTMPALSKSDATSRLFALGTPNEVVLLPKPGPGDTLIPFSDPNVLASVCPFDLRAAPLRIRVAQGSQYLTVAFLQPGGSIFYSLSDKANPNGALDIRLTNAAQLQVIEANDPDDQDVAELRVTAPVDTGIVLVRGLAGDPTQSAETERRIGTVRCLSEPLAPPPRR